MTDILVNDFLEHHGVKGMKWGVRKKRSTKEPRLSDHQKAVVKDISKGVLLVGSAVAADLLITHGSKRIRKLRG